MSRAKGEYREVAKGGGGVGYSRQMRCGRDIEGGPGYCDINVHSMSMRASTETQVYVRRYRRKDAM